MGLCGSNQQEPAGYLKFGNTLKFQTHVDSPLGFNCSFAILKGLIPPTHF